MNTPNRNPATGSPAENIIVVNSGIPKITAKRTNTGFMYNDIKG